MLTRMHEPHPKRRLDGLYRIQRMHDGRNFHEVGPCAGHYGDSHTIYKKGKRTKQPRALG